MSKNLETFKVRRDKEGSKKEEEIKKNFLSTQLFKKKIEGLKQEKKNLLSIFSADSEIKKKIEDIDAEIKMARMFQKIIPAMLEIVSWPIESEDLKDLSPRLIRILRIALIESQKLLRPEIDRLCEEFQREEFQLEDKRGKRYVTSVYEWTHACYLETHLAQLWTLHGKESWEEEKEKERVLNLSDKEREKAIKEIQEIMEKIQMRKEETEEKIEGVIKEYLRGWIENQKKEWWERYSGPAA